MHDETNETARMRLDKWLWAARFYKTRSLAVEEIAKGRIDVNGQPAKPSRELRPDDRVAMRIGGGVIREVVVRGLSGVRGPASVAQTLYEETPESIAARERAVQARRQGIEPALTIEQGRPTKRDRRKLAEWDRWRVSVDDD